MDYSEYLDLAVQLITTNERPNVPFAAAALGGLLLKAAPEVTFKTFGKRTLGEVLDDLQARGRIILTKTDKGALAMVRVGDSVKAPAHTDAYNPLHRSMWEAFTFVAPPGRRFLNRQTGVIRVGLLAAPAPADEWVEITAIAPELQRQWAVEFTAEQPPEVASAMQPALEPDGWNAHAFITSVRDQHPQVARAWNAFRSSRVSAHVQKWLMDNALPTNWAFQQHALAPRPAGAALIPGWINSEAETREIVMSALAQMPLGQLLTIPIPVGLVLTALSTRKH